MRGETILLIKKIRAHFLICLAPKIMHVPAVYFLMETLFAHRPNTISLDICCLAWPSWTLLEFKLFSTVSHSSLPSVSFWWGWHFLSFQGRMPNLSVCRSRVCSLCLLWLAQTWAHDQDWLSESWLWDHRKYLSSLSWVFMAGGMDPWNRHLEHSPSNEDHRRWSLATHEMETLNDGGHQHQALQMRVAFLIWTS